MCIRDRTSWQFEQRARDGRFDHLLGVFVEVHVLRVDVFLPVSYTHLRAHETVLDLVCRLLLEKKNNTQYTDSATINIAIIQLYKGVTLLTMMRDDQPVSNRESTT